MAQHDYDINSSDAISGLQFRQDVNNVLSAIKSSNSGATAPTTYIAGTLWLDTSTTPHILKKRNTANTGWDTIRIEDALGAPIASGATTTVGTYSGGNTVHITGTTTITSLGVSTTGTTRNLIFDSALTITHNATSLICPNGLSITTVTGDAITVICEDGALGYWKVSSISRLMPSELSYLINSATAKATPVDADKFGIWDSVSGLLNSVSWANIKATLKIGTITNDNASAGQIGEYISSTILVASAVSLTTSAVTSITSISLSAGDWDVIGKVGFITSTTTSVVRVSSFINTSVAFSNDLDAVSQQIYAGGSVLNTPANGEAQVPCGKTRISIAVPTTIYLLAIGTFTVSTLTAHGTISARRVR